MPTGPEPSVKQGTGVLIGTYVDFRTGEPLQAITRLAMDAAYPPIEQYAYRTLDRQQLVSDSRAADFIRPALWHAFGNRQIYLTSLLTTVLGTGPAATVAAQIPDRHHFRGSYGGKDVIPLWRDPDASEPNVTTGLLDTVGEALGLAVTPADLFAYAYALLASPAYVDSFSEELTVPGPRLPLTKNPALFQRAVDMGAELIWRHTYGERFTGPDRSQGSVPPGSARCERPVGETPDAYPEGFEYNENTQNPAGRRRPVRAGFARGLAVFSLRFFGSARVAGLQDAGRRGAQVVAAGRDKTRTLDRPIHPRASGAAVGPRSDGRAAAGARATAGPRGGWSVPQRRRSSTAD